jgi:hypothetical protein
MKDGAAFLAPMEVNEEGQPANQSGEGLAELAVCGWSLSFTGSASGALARV